MLEPRGRGIVLRRLRYGEVRDGDTYFAGIGHEQKMQKMMPLVEQLIENQNQPWNPKVVIDPVQDRLLNIIAGEKKALKKSSTAEAKTPALISVINNGCLEEVARNRYAD
jgi:DNA end-binding protein Ku